MTILKAVELCNFCVNCDAFFYFRTLWLIKSLKEQHKSKMHFCPIFNDKSLLVSSPLSISKGVPQGSVLGPILFILYINILDRNVSKCKFSLLCQWHWSILLCSNSKRQLLLAFDTVQCTLFDLKLVLNDDKTKIMLFSNVKSNPLFTT